MRIVHPDGTWIVNTCRFPMADPTQNVLLEPNEPTCIRLTEWLEMQMRCGLFTKVPSPIKSAGPVVKPKV